MKYRFYFIIALLLISYTSAFATSITVQGNVSGTWAADTVLVDGDLMIPFGETLTIAPGTFIQFQSYSLIDVKGSIIAMGAPGDTILFTIRDTSNFYSQNQGRGGWSGIKFRQLSPEADSSLFSYCRFEYGKATEDSLNCYGGAIFAHGFNKLRINNCYFYNNYSYFNGGAIYLHEANAKIYNCTFRNGYSGNQTIGYGYGGGICAMYSSPEIRNNSFFANISTGVGGAVSFDNSNPLFDNNIMQYNYSGLGGGLGILRCTPTATLSNNLIINNEAMFFGGGMCCIRSFPVLSNFTICSNTSVYGGGFYCNDSAVPSMYNSIIWDNSGFGESVYIWDVYSAPSFQYCNVMGDTMGFEGSGAHLGYHGQYLDNMNTNPMLQTQGQQIFSLQAFSPCIDAGTPNTSFLNLPMIDLADAPRIINFRIDMGAYEYPGNMGCPNYSEKNNTIKVQPNPFSGACRLLFQQVIELPVEVNIYSVSGILIRKLYFTDTNLTWDGKTETGADAGKGIFFAKCFSNGTVYQTKLIRQ